MRSIKVFQLNQFSLEWLQAIHIYLGSKRGKGGNQKNKELGYVQYIIKTLIDKMSKVIIYKDYLAL